MQELTVRPDTLPLQSITLSEQEQAEGRLSAGNRELATLLLSCRGYVVLKNAVPLEFVTRLRQEFEDIFEDCRTSMNKGETDASPEAVHQVTVSAKKGASFWFRKARYRIFPRLVGPMGDPLLLANPFVVPILEELLGPDFACRYVTSDTCVNGAILQSPHSDILMNDAFVDNHWKARGYVVNVPIMDCGLHNGPIEVWPGGSHLWTSDMMDKHGLAPYVQDGRNPPVERVAEFFPSIKLAIHPGEILIRDLAMWHRGTPNPTDTPRTMMTIGYFRHGYAYGYGDASYNVDRSIHQQFHPRIRRMFDYHFSMRSVLGRKKRKLQARVRAATEKLKGGSTRAQR